MYLSLKVEETDCLSIFEARSSSDYKNKSYTPQVDQKILSSRTTKRNTD